MKNLIYYLAICSIATVFMAAASCQKANALSVTPNNKTRLYYEQNKGQWHNNIQYRLQLPSSYVFLEKNRFTYLLINGDDVAAFHDHHTLPNCLEKNIRTYAYKVAFAGALPTVQVSAAQSAATYHNYFIGNNPNKWASNVQLYQQVHYAGLYKGIDMHVYSIDDKPKYDFEVHAGANAQQIQLSYEGATRLELINGSLHVVTPQQTVVEQPPFAYQIIEGKKIQVACAYVLKGNKVGFAFPNGYNAKHTLIIDPTLVFATFTGSVADNWGFTATYGKNGTMYTGGICFNFGYPTTTGAFDVSFNGPADPGMDIVISKFNASGTNLIYSTYLGGSNSSEFPHSLIADPDDNLVMFGTTGSSNYPTTTGCYDASFNGGTDTNIDGYINLNSGSDIVITKFNASGTALLGSTYYGGNKNDGLNQSDLKYNYADDARGEVFLDENNNIYIASCTRSGNLPTTSGSFQPTIGGQEDACIARFNSNLSALTAATFLGGSEDDGAYSVKIDAAGIVYVCGGTRSTNLPITAGSYKTTYSGGNADGFIAKLNATFSNLLASTYLGTAGYDQSFFVDLDEDNQILTVGQTDGNYPVSAGVYNNANSGIYIQKFDNSLNSSIWSTRIGNGNGKPNISPTAFLVDRCNRIYISGWGGQGVNTSVPGSTTAGLPVTPDAFQGSTDANDFYFMALEENATELVYATFFGGSGIDEHVDGGTSRFDKSGIIYEAICGGCGGQSQMPTTAGAWSGSNNSINCNLAAVKFDFQISPTFASIAANPAYSGCVPFTVQFANFSTNATEYFWDLGNGTTSTTLTPTVTYTQTGNYEVMLIARDPNSCNIADTAYTIISVVDPLSFSADFTYSIDCINLNVSTTPVEATNAHIWQFSDGFTTTDVNAFHHFSEPGTYAITHIINSTVVGCPATDTVTQNITILPSVLAGFVADTTFGCIPLTVNFSNQSTNATTYVWDFGNGNTLTNPNGSTTFTTPGSYTVSLTASNPNTCNLNNTATLNIIALDTIIAAQFTETLPGVCDTQTVVFSSNSGAGLGYIWAFGDGTIANGTDANPSHTYGTSGTYQVTLIVTSPCAPSDTTTHPITLLPPPLVVASIELSPQNGCVPLAVSMQANGNAVLYTWDLGDGTTATGTTLEHLYSNVGSYNIILTATDSSTCNINTTATTSVDVFEYAYANFTASTLTIEATDPIYFTNLSTNATSYVWDFGDGTTSAETNPSHSFNAAGTYNVCLTAINQAGCNDDTCVLITVIPRIYIGVPNAFSPNQDNQNNVFLIEGRNGIAYMELRIYNRWGELIYESTDPQAGWDGTYKGVIQEVDAYAYTFVATLISGRQVRKQGNITLVR